VVDYNFLAFSDLGGGYSVNCCVSCDLVILTGITAFKVVLETDLGNPPAVRVSPQKLIVFVPNPSTKLTCCFLAGQAQTHTHQPARIARIE
jgi:hypothetical protein